MKKLLLFSTLIILSITCQGCFWNWFIATAAVSGHIEKKDKERDEYTKAITAKKYEKINQRRKRLGLPQIEVPEYQREKSTLYN
ncbi:hypothetical protein KKC59_02780 [bacterium]|nr:hypothetical protein [bacterium]